MIVKTIPSSWLIEEEHRLDCGPFVKGSIEAKKVIDGMHCKKDRLVDLTKGGLAGMYHVGQDKIVWVDDSEHGMPFLRSSDILKADLSDQPFISRKQVRNNYLFQCPAGTTLITRSGSIGRMVFARKEMEDMAISQDVLKVVPDEKKVLSGYLYAFLSSKYGVPIVTGGTFGSIIVHIEAGNIANLPVPRLGEVEEQAHALVQQAADLRSEANSLLQDTSHALERELGVPSLPDYEPIHQVVSSSEIMGSKRMDAYYFNSLARRVTDWAINHKNGMWELSVIADIFDVPPFKHIYVDAEDGLPFFTSGELFDLERKADKFLSKTQTKNLKKYILGQGWVLLARSGQIGGIICRPQFSDSALAGTTTSDHVIRIVPKQTEVPAGYIYAFLETSTIGYPLLARTISGTSIPALWPDYLESLPVVKSPKKFMSEIDLLVQKAFEMRVQATGIENQARTLVENAIEAGGRSWRK